MFQQINFKGRRTLEFKPGLNILFGPNGSGKSTALNILAQTVNHPALKGEAFQA